MRFILLSALGLGSLCCQAQKAMNPSPAEQWEKLIDSNKIGQANQLCGSWVRSAKPDEQVEAQKCLANVALAKGSRLTLEGNETGGGTLGSGYSPEAVEDALKHLNEGIRLAPQDIKIHEGRLHVLEVAGRYDEMMKALEQTLTVYKGDSTPNVWLPYAAELANYGEPTAGLKFCEVLDKHFPNNSDIIGNLGAFHNMLKQWDLGLPYVRRAVEMNPTDPIDTWNLGWTLNHLDQNDEAEKWMAKSLSLDKASPDTAERSCLYGHFLVSKRNRTQEGCALVNASCEEADRKGCAPPSGSSTK